MADCSCELCQARAAGLDPMEYAYRNKPIELALVRRNPGHLGYEYEQVARDIEARFPDRTIEEKIGRALAMFEHRGCNIYRQLLLFEEG